MADDERLPPRVRHAHADLLDAFERLAEAVMPALPDGARPVDMFHNPRYIVLRAPGERCDGVWYEAADLPRLPLPDRPDAGRRRVAVEILTQARVLQAGMDGDPDLAADPMVAGEVEGLWAAVRIADPGLWQVEHDKGGGAKRD